MKYIIIGLGNYGGGLAEELMAIGHEVIGVDQNEGRVDNLKDKITTAFVLDATDELALETLPLREIDVVIVAIGENFGASVRVVALLKQKKVKHIFARAIDSVHKAILEAFAIDKVLTPEKDAAREFVQFLALGIHAESFRVDEDYYVIKFKVPRKCAGYPLSGMNLEEDFHLKLIALKQAAEVKNILGMKKLTKEHFKNRGKFSFPFTFYFLLFPLSLPSILNRFNALKINPLWKGVLKFGQAVLAMK